jgi:hypothetical protein
MSMSKENIEKQVDVSKYPAEYRQAFLYALKEGKLLLLNLEMTDRDLMNDIMPFINANPVITLLNVQDNKLTWKAALALSHNKTIRTLHIGGNTIGDLGAEFLSENKTLTTLDAWANEIGDKGAKALSRNKNIKKLNLFANDVKEQGAIALSQNETLHTLGIMRNAIGVGKYNLLLADNKRKKNYENTKVGFLSIMTETKVYLPAMRDGAIFGKKEIAKMKDKFDYMQETNKQKKSTLLFQYANKSVDKKGDNKLSRELVEEILSYVKPEAFKVVM